MKLACDDCPEYNSEACLRCRYMQKLIPSIYRGEKKKECLSEDGTIPPIDQDYPDYKETIYDNAKAIQAIKSYIACPDKHKAVFTLYLAGFNKKRIGELLTLNRSTIHRILAVFE